MSLFDNSKESENEKLNSLYGVEVVSMAHSHIMYLTFKYFLQSIEQSVFKCPKIKENLLNLAKVYALSEI